MREASSWSRVTDVAASSARDRLEAGLNEAAYFGHALWAFQQGWVIEEELRRVVRVTVSTKLVC